MTYSPFNDDFSCKTASQVLSDIKRMATKGIQSVRIYATECNTLYTVAPALKKTGMKLIQGFYMTSAGVDSIDSQVYDFVNWLGEDSSNVALVEMLIVGNEAVMNVSSRYFEEERYKLIVELGFGECVIAEDYERQMVCSAIWWVLGTCDDGGTAFNVYPEPIPLYLLDIGFGWNKCAFVF